MVRSAVQVYLRVRPPTGPVGNVQFLPDAQAIQVSASVKQATATDHSTGQQQFQFKFDGVLNNVPQERVFEACAKTVLDNALQGYNGTVMCYGQTGAGKTYTMTGNKASYDQRGLIPRTVTQLFKEIRLRQLDRSIKVQVSYLEIYNEQLYDLLDISAQPDDILLHEDAKGQVAVRGLTVADVASEMEALRLLFEGETNRVIGEHQLNRESSRSHSIFTILLLMPSEGDGEAVTAKVNLVDLAGSERVSKTKSEGQVLREAGQINKSLSHLEQVILALSEKGRDHVPYRSSKLTHVLKNSLGGNCRTVLIANAWADQSQLDETLSTCRFAQRMQRISNEVTVNVVQESSARVKQLEREIAELKQELAVHDSMAQRPRVKFSPFTDAQRSTLEGQVATFLAAELGPDDPLEALGLHTARAMREALMAARKIYLAVGGGLPVGEGAASGTARPTSATNDEHRAEVAGDGAGAAGGAAGSAGGGDSASSRSMPGETSGMPPPDRKLAFEDYKMGPGLQKAELMAANRAKLKQARKRAKDLAVEINSLKRSMDTLKVRADELKAARQARGEEGAQVLEAEEYDALTQLRDLKARYREQYSELQMVRSEADYTGQLVEQCTQELLLEFNTWYEVTYGVPGLLDGMAMFQADAESMAGPPGSSGARLGTAGSCSSQGSSASSINSQQRKVPLASLVGGSGGHDADAELYYLAQEVLYTKLDGVHRRPGSVKKDRSNKGTFSSATRTDITAAKVAQDLGALPHRRH